MTAADRVDVEQYLHILRDPVDLGELEFRRELEPMLVGRSSGLAYPFVGAFPDLRPDAGLSATEAARRRGLGAATAASHARVRDHYDDKPCHNYLCLDNVPLGRYLRDRHYDPYFEGTRLVVEVGCGKGGVASAFKQYRGITPFCIDLAYGSLRHVRRPPLSADGVLGSNLALPLADGVADVVVSYGVIHHTPNPFLCFRELVRILKPGGRLLLGVYNWENLYRCLYHFFSPPFHAIQRTFGKRLGEFLLKVTAFPGYHLVLWGVLGLTQGRWAFPSLAASWEQFGDFFLTPIAHFYHAGELRTWGETLGLRVLEQETGGAPRNGFSHFVWYQKLPVAKTPTPACAAAMHDSNSIPSEQPPTQGIRTMP